jgi:hypothetical protein
MTRAFLWIGQIETERILGDQAVEQRGSTRLPRPEQEVDVGAAQFGLQFTGIPSVKHAVKLCRPYLKCTLFLSPKPRAVCRWKIQATPHSRHCGPSAR